MFKNRALQVKMVRPVEDEITDDTTIGDTLEAINDMIAKNVKPVAIAVISVIAAKTASEVVLHTARTFIK